MSMLLPSNQMPNHQPTSPRWLFDTLPTTIAARDPPHCTAAELVDIVRCARCACCGAAYPHNYRWKLSRGKWRPSLLGYAKAHSESTVVEATTAALAALGPSPAPLESVTAALNHLTALKGVGVATASAILAVIDPSVPFMSDEAIAAVLGSGDKRYTLPVYLQVVRWMRTRAEALQRSTPDDGVVWRVCEVERALWAEGASKHASGKKEAASQQSTKKRRKT